MSDEKTTYNFNNPENRLQHRVYAPPSEASTKSKLVWDIADMLLNAKKPHKFNNVYMLVTAVEPDFNPGTLRGQYAAWCANRLAK